MKTIYILKLNNYKYLSKLVKYHIQFIKVKYRLNSCLLYVDDENYLKIQKYLDIYDIHIVDRHGFLKWKQYFLKYFIFIISIIIGLIWLCFLQNIIFDVQVMTNNKELQELIMHELDFYNLRKYVFIKSYDEKELIKNNILKEYHDKLEWMEIDRVGTKYYIRLLERVQNNREDNETYRNVVAKRNAVIKEIKASKGEIVKKVNDYVDKGDVVIASQIKKNDEVKNLVRADGIIYGETWYTVRVELPHTYEEREYTSRSYQRLTIDWFNQRIFLFGKKNYQDEEYSDKTLISNAFLPFKLNWTTVKEVRMERIIYTYMDALSKGMILAKEKLLTSLSSDSEIKEEKKLNLYEDNNKIIVDVFFRVYENITDYQDIVME